MPEWLEQSRHSFFIPYISHDRMRCTVRFYEYRRIKTLTLRSKRTIKSTLVSLGRKVRVF